MSRIINVRKILFHPSEPFAVRTYVEGFSGPYSLTGCSSTDLIRRSAQCQKRKKGKSQTFDIVRNVAYNERTGTLMFVLGTLVCNADGTHTISCRGVSMTFRSQGNETSDTGRRWRLERPRAFLVRASTRDVTWYPGTPTACPLPREPNSLELTFRTCLAGRRCWPRPAAVCLPGSMPNRRHCTGTGIGPACAPIGEESLRCKRSRRARFAAARRDASQYLEASLPPLRSCSRRKASVRSPLVADLVPPDCW